MGKFIDLTGQRFGRLVVLRRNGRSNSGCIKWECQCDCGNIITTTRLNLRSGDTKSCGCYHEEKLHETEDLTGQKFGRLTALRNTGIKGANSYYWECRCDCGVIKNVQASCLKGGTTRSCGCLSSEVTAARNKADAKKRIIDITGKRYGNLTVEGIDKKESGRPIRWICRCDCGNTISLTRPLILRRSEKDLNCGCAKGLCYSKKYPRMHKIWVGMKQRCTNNNNPDYDDYGGRGITICQEWLEDFMNFYNWSMANGYSDDLSIDRIDVNGNYEPGNCRWATQKEQANNKRSNRYIEHNGVVKTLSEWADYAGLDYSCLYGRLDLGWDFERAISTPTIKKNKKATKVV